MNMLVACDKSFTILAVFHFRPHLEMKFREAACPRLRINLQFLPVSIPQCRASRVVS